MSFHVAFYFAVSAIILTQTAIESVNGQSTTEDRGHDGLSMNIITEIQQQIVHALYPLNTQTQNIHDFLTASSQQLTSQLNAAIRSLQAVDRRLEEHDAYIKQGICDVVPPVRDCSDIKARGHTANGVYEVCAGHKPNRVCANAYCDMKTNNGRSLVFQRRKDGSVNFNRTWAEYKEGFGNPDGEFWLGNEMLYLLTSKRNYTLRVDLEDWEGEKRYAEYSNFSIGSSTDNYRLTVGRYSGNAGYSMNRNNGKQFSTIDADNDEYQSGNYPGQSCAWRLGGAWWYDWCSDACLNCIYYNRNDTVRTTDGGIYWVHWKNRQYYFLQAAEMKLVPVA